MKNKTSHCKPDDFVARAERAFRRVARQPRAEHARLGLPLVFGDGGKVKLVYVDEKAKKPVKHVKRKRNHKSSKTPAFVTRAESALRRAAQSVRAENRALGLPLIVWQKGKLVKKPT
ncbi:MAG TPA: hypothetical protein VH255_00350 [Verrucomicrobiae bacterium]|jgi:hypothetical protein|nr:hypothetical protein [Verrucomicrobiae bacterium]